MNCMCTNNILSFLAYKHPHQSAISHLNIQGGAMLSSSLHAAVPTAGYRRSFHEVEMWVLLISSCVNSYYIIHCVYYVKFSWAVQNTIIVYIRVSLWIISMDVNIEIWRYLTADDMNFIWTLCSHYLQAVNPCMVSPHIYIHQIRMPLWCREWLAAEWELVDLLDMTT